MTFTRGEPYERFIGRWSRQLAPRFVEWLAIPPGRRWLDVGAGTGALSAAIRAHAAPASLVGVEPSDGYRALAHANLPEVQFLAGDAAHVPLPDASVDVAAAALVLNFVPDLDAALAELARVVAPGGTIAGYVWDLAGRMEILSKFWEAVRAVAPTPEDERTKFSLCSEAAMRGRFDEVVGLELEARFADFDDYWEPFLGGQGPAPMYLATLDAATRDRIRDRLRASLPDGAFTLHARAWAGRRSR